MKIALFILLIVQFASARTISSDCKCRDIALYGNVKIVTAGEDFKVRVVTAGEDLRVQVSDVGTSCGKWHFVEAGENFRIRFVTAGEDFTIAFSDVPGIAP